MTLEEKVTQMLHSSPAIPGLGIPAYNWWNEALHGVARAGTATVFPQAIAMAATFDEDLVYRIAEVISTEGWAKSMSFGYGLSYTKFVYSKLKINKKVIEAGEKVECIVKVKNVGSYDSEETVQLYLKDIDARVVISKWELKGVRKIFLKTGKKQR